MSALGQKQTRSCPLYHRKRTSHAVLETVLGSSGVDHRPLAHLAPLQQHTLGCRNTFTQILQRLRQFLVHLRFFGILISQPVQQIDILGHSFFRDLERREARQLGHRLIAKLSPAAGDAARRKFAALLRLNTRDV
jgi:hypothetical protein